MIQQVDKEIQTLIEEIDYDELNRHLSLLMGGKRLRAKLILTIAKEHSNAPLLGAIVELIHSSSLLHDDVIDEATIRRGTDCVNATEGSKTAIMIGDILYAKSFSALTFFDREIAYKLSSAVTLLSIGEMMDVKLSAEFNDDEQKYIRMLYLKTASLMEATAECAALLAGKDAAAYANYGKNLGLAFQIVDDILDIVSDEKTLGKPALSDFKEGKCTLPYIYLFHALEDHDKQTLRSLHAKELSDEQTRWIQEKMQQHHCIKKAFELAQRLTEEAKTAVPHETKLIEILDNMIKRSY